MLEILKAAEVEVIALWRASPGPEIVHQQIWLSGKR
jgi:hypothetical protein